MIMKLFFLKKYLFFSGTHILQDWSIIDQFKQFSFFGCKLT